MKKYFKKSVGVLLILFILLSALSGCVNPEVNDGDHAGGENNSGGETNQGSEENGNGDNTEHTHFYEWVTDIEPTYTTPGVKHKECECGDKIEENTEIPKKKTDGGVVLSEELILTLTEHLEDYWVQYDIPGHTFGDKLFLLENGFKPLLVKYSDECYYAVAYYTPSHDFANERIDYCCCNEYLWVGFDSVEKIKETWDGMELVSAFQVNPPEISKNLKTNSTEMTMEHFMQINLVFSGGAATVSEVEFDDFFIYITNKEDDYFYYSSEVAYHEPWSIRCIDIDGEYYIQEYFSTEKNNGSYIEINLDVTYGKYHDSLVEIMYDYYVENKEDRIITYSLFKIGDIVEIIK